MAPSICHLPGGGAGYKVLPWSDLMIRVVEPWNPLLMWAGPGPPSLSYIHIRLIDEALFQSSYRPFRCGRHIQILQYFQVVSIAKLPGTAKYTQKNFHNACYQVGFCTEGISTGATPQDKYCK